MWVAVNLPHHMFMDNPAKAIAEYLNQIGATIFHLIDEDAHGDINGIAWVPQ